MVSASEKKLRLAAKTFVMRSPKRDVGMDRKRIVPIMEAIASAIQEISVERTGLIARVQKTNIQRELLTKTFPTRAVFQFLCLCDAGWPLFPADS